METPELLVGYDEELALFKASEPATKRPFWPNCPADCTVVGCNEQIYNSYSSFQRHWANKHVKDIIVYKCPNCTKTSARRDNLVRHQTKVHKMKTEIEGVLQPNHKFVDANGALPYVFDHRERMSTKRKILSEAAVGDILVRGGQVCRDQEVVEENGVLWHANHAIPGTVEAVQKLKSLGKRIFYVTNNSSKTRAQVVTKCQELGFPAEVDNIVCTAHAAAQYLKSMNFTGKVYMVGNPSMAQEMDSLEINHVGLGPDPMSDGQDGSDEVVEFQTKWIPDPEVNCVLVGFDAHHSFKKMLKASSYAKNRNNLFLATNEDPFLPIKSETVCIPGTGSIVASIKIPARREPHIIGKPETSFFDLLHETHGLKAESTIMVGDSLNTDIHMAVNCDIKSLLVLTGADGLQQVEQHQHCDDPVKRKVVPDYYIDSFAHFGQFIADL